MAIKMIAVDMDGTFLDDYSSYNQERFYRIYQILKDRTIHFDDREEARKVFEGSVI